MTYQEITTALNEAELCIKQDKFAEAERLCYAIVDVLDEQQRSMQLEVGYDLSSSGSNATAVHEQRTQEKEYAYYHARTRNLLCKALLSRDITVELQLYAEKALHLAQQAEAETEVAIACNNLGRWYQFSAEYHRALEYFQKGLAIYERMGDTYGIAQISGNIGLTYSSISDTHNALPYLQQAVALHEELGNKDGIARNLCNLGTVYKLMSDFPSAMEYMKRALALEEELGNKVGIANNLGNIGLLYVELSDYHRALEYMQKTLVIFQETGNKKGIAGTLSNIGSAYSYLYDHSRALEYFGKALRINEEMGNTAWKINNLGGIGSVYHALSDYSKALEYYQMALELSEEIGKKDSISSIISKIGGIYGSLSELDKALKYFRKSLEMSRDNGHKAGVAWDLDNIGKVYLLQKDYSRAKESMQEALAINEEIGFRRGVAGNYGSIGDVYYEQGDYAKALEYFQTSLEIFRENDSVGGVAISLTSIGLIYASSDNAEFDNQKAEEYFLQAIKMSESIGAKNTIGECHRALADLYQTTKRWEEANTHFRKFYDLEKEVKSDEVKKKTEQMEHHRQAAEREKEIAIERTRATAEKRILNNILPEEITQRLINGENPIADHFDSVSVLFMDIVNFTPLASLISAQQLVHLLNVIFSATDSVIRECGMEKIKTIGDAYMAVAGAPVAQADHALRAARAAVTLLDKMQNLVVTFPDSYGDRSWIASIPEIQVRIGLHCGSAAAGVVGENKFAYDLWGDAVNTASRMESHGEAGKIHVSEEFKHAAETVHAPSLHAETLHAPSLRFIPRGEMEIKGKGTMNTYFMERA